MKALKVALGISVGVASSALAAWAIDAQPANGIHMMLFIWGLLGMAGGLGVAAKEIFE